MARIIKVYTINRHTPIGDVQRLLKKYKAVIDFNGLGGPFNPRQVVRVTLWRGDVGERTGHGSTMVDAYNKAARAINRDARRAARSVSLRGVARR